MRLELLTAAAVIALSCQGTPYLTANFSSGIPSGFTLHNADGAAVESGIYNRIGNDPNVAWIAGQLAGGYGRAALAPTRTATGIAAERWMILPEVAIADAGAVIRWEARSLHKHLPESYKVMVREADSEAWHEIYACAAENHAFTKHAVSLAQYTGKNVQLAFVATTTMGFILAVDNVMVGVPDDDAYTFTNTSLHYAADTGTTAITGRLTYFGDTCPWTSLTLKGIGEPLSISLPQLKCGESVDVNFDVTLSRGTTYDYTIEASGENGTATIATDFITCSYFERMHVVDRCSGTWCNNCPMMELTTTRLEGIYGPQMAVLEPHINDQLSNEQYSLQYLGEVVFAIPALIANHETESGKISYGLSDNDNYSSHLANETFAKVSSTAQRHANGIIDIAAEMQSAVDLDNSADNYRIAYMLAGDFHDPLNGFYIQDLSAMSYKYDQFYYMCDKVMPELMFFDNVPVEASTAYSGVASSLPTEIAPYTAYTHRYSITIPDDCTATNLRVLAMVIDNSNGHILNACWVVPTEISEAPESPVRITPAPGEVASLSEFELNFDGNWGMGSHRSARITVTGPEGVHIPSIGGQSNGVGYEFSFVDDAVISTPGEYVVTIPAGKFAIDEVDLDAVSFVYQVTGAVAPEFFSGEITISPAEGAYKSIDNGFRLTFDTTDPMFVIQDKVQLMGPEEYISVMANVPSGANYIDVTPIDASGNPMAITNVGEYTLIFEKGSIVINNVANPRQLLYTYNVIGEGEGHWTGAVTANPASESVVTELHYIDITFDGASTVTVSNSAAPRDFPTLYDADNKVVTQCTAFARGNVLELSLYSTVTTPGVYTLVIPKKFLKVDGISLISDIVAAVYTIDGTQGSMDYTYTLLPTPESQISANANITITFAGDNLASVANDPFAWGNNAPHFTNEIGAYNPNLQIMQNGNTFVLRHEWPFEVDGLYKLVIPAGYFTITDNNGLTVNNEAIEVTYNVSISGINDTNADSQAPLIFTITGVRLPENSNLPAGIYIINGEKVKK